MYIYDSLNREILNPVFKTFIQKLYPHINENEYKSPTVQHQPNYIDCGVYAIANATTLAFGLKPDEVTYDHDLMRKHLLQICEEQSIKFFPQDTSQPLQFVPSLSIAVNKTVNKILKQNNNKIEKTNVASKKSSDINCAIDSEKNHIKVSKRKRTDENDSTNSLVSSNKSVRIKRSKSSAKSNKVTSSERNSSSAISDRAVNKKLVNRLPFATDLLIKKRVNRLPFATDLLKKKE